MSVSAVQRLEPATASFDDRRPPRVWLSDAFCFTPWYSVALVSALRDAGASVRFITPKIEREPDYFSRHGIEADPGPFHLKAGAGKPSSKVGKAFRLASVLGNSAALSWQLKQSAKERPDVFHVQQMPALNHGILTDFKLIAAAQRVGVPVVHTVHNLLPHDSGNKLLATYRRLYEMVDMLICHSDDAAEALTKDFFISPQKISVIPHGPLFEVPIATNHEQALARESLGIERSRPVVLWQGVMAPYKGLDVLLRAWTLCMLRWKNSRERPLLLIAGAGTADEEAMVAAAVEESRESIRAELRYIATSELPFYFHAADLLVYPYRAITTSGALLTGLSYRKPIVASDLAPFRQYLHHNDNALLVSPGSVEELSDALYVSMRGIIEHADSRTLYQTLLRGAACNRERYVSWDAIATQTLTAYRKLTAGR